MPGSAFRDAAVGFGVLREPGFDPWHERWLQVREAVLCEDAFASAAVDQSARGDPQLFGQFLDFRPFFSHGTLVANVSGGCHGYGWWLAGRGRRAYVSLAADPVGRVLH